jgi:hypothetical protein
MSFNPYHGIVRAFDLNGTVRWTYDQYGDYVDGVALCNDGSIGVAGSWGQLDATYGDVFTAFHMNDGGVIIRLLDDVDEPGSIFDVAISDNGAYAVCGGKAVHARTMGNGGQIYSLDLTFAPPPVIDATLTPINPPIVIPVGGGTFQYRANIRNTTTSAQTFQIWTRWMNPLGIWANLLGPIPLTLPGSANVTRQRNQNVAGSNPPGTYTFVGYAGPNATTIWDSSFFTFTKSATDMGGEWVYNNDNWGEPFPGEEGGACSIMPNTPALRISPNPFNPSTAASFELRAASYVTLRVYDTAGREVATLVNGWREAGSHEVTFDASGLPSGVYLGHLTAGGQTAITKMVLMK